MWTVVESTGLISCFVINNEQSSLVKVFIDGLIQNLVATCGTTIPQKGSDFGVANWCLFYLYITRHKMNHADIC